MAIKYSQEQEKSDIDSSIDYIIPYKDIILLDKKEGRYFTVI